MNPWVRLYRTALHNPKIVSLNDRQHRTWHNLLLVADDRGRLPAARDIACHLRMTIPEAEAMLSELIEAGLVDVDCSNPNSRQFAMHDWSVHQYVSDSSTARVKKFRNKNNGRSDETALKRFSNGAVTPSDTDSDSDSVLPLPVSSRARRDEQGMDSGFGRKGTKGKGDDPLEALRCRAEGFGLPAGELIEATARKGVRNPSAYFTTLAVNRLQDQLPAVDARILRDALWGKDHAVKLVFAALTHLEAVA